MKPPAPLPTTSRSTSWSSGTAQVSRSGSVRSRPSRSSSGCVWGATRGACVRSRRVHDPRKRVKSGEIVPPAGREDGESDQPGRRVGGEQAVHERQTRQHDGAWWQLDRSVGGIEDADETAAAAVREASRRASVPIDFAARALGSVARSSSAARYSDSVDVTSSSCASTVRSAHSAGIGSHVSGAVEKPKGGDVPSHGIGTRHPSRPRSVWPDRSHTGSCSAASGRSTFGSPSSAPL